MKARVLRREKNELEFELEGEDHTFCNPLVKTLLTIEGVDFGAYHISHPLVRIPRIYVRTRGELTPEEALIKAADKMISILNEIKEKFNEEISKLKSK